MVEEQAVVVDRQVVDRLDYCQFFAPLRKCHSQPEELSLIHI